MEPMRPKRSPGGLNGAQESKMELRRPKWSPGGPNRAQEAQMDPSCKCANDKFSKSVQLIIAMN